LEGNLDLLFYEQKNVLKPALYAGNNRETFWWWIDSWIAKAVKGNILVSPYQVKVVFSQVITFLILKNAGIGLKMILYLHGKSLKVILKIMPGLGRHCVMCVQNVAGKLCFFSQIKETLLVLYCFSE
jgi:hypothetical protein